MAGKKMGFGIDDGSLRFVRGLIVTLAFAWFGRHCES